MLLRQTEIPHQLAAYSRKTAVYKCSMCANVPDRKVLIAILSLTQKSTIM